MLTCSQYLLKDCSQVELLDTCTLLDYFHFLLLYISDPLHSVNKYSTCYSITFLLITVVTSYSADYMQNHSSV